MEYQTFAKSNLLIFFANLAVLLSGIILLSVLTKNLPAQEYGLWVQITVTITLIPMLIVMGLPTYSFMRFLSEEEDKEIIKEDFYSTLSVIVIVSLITFLIISLFSKQISSILFDNNVEIVHILSLILFIEPLNLLFLNYYITFQEIKKYSLLLFFKAALSTILIYFLIFLGFGITGAIIGFLITEIVLFLVCFSNIFLTIGISIPHFKRIKEYLAMGIPTVPGSLSYWIVDASDRYLIGILLSNVYVAYYSPAYTLGGVITMFSSPLSSLLITALSKSYDEGDESKVLVLLNSSIKYFLALGIPSAVGLSILSKPLLTILSTEDIALNGYLITPFIAFGFLLLGLNNIIVNIIILEKKTKIIGIIWLISGALNLILNLILIPILGILGAAISTLITYSIPFLLLTFYSMKIVKFNLNYLIVLKICLASTPIVFTYLLWKPNGIIELFVFIFANVVIYLILVLILNVFSKKELHFIKGLFNLH